MHALLQDLLLVCTISVHSILSYIIVAGKELLAKFRQEKRLNNVSISKVCLAWGPDAVQEP